MQAFHAPPGLSAQLDELAAAAARNVGDVCTTCAGNARGGTALPSDLLAGLTGGIAHGGEGQQEVC